MPEPLHQRMNVDGQEVQGRIAESGTARDSVRGGRCRSEPGVTEACEGRKGAARVDACSHGRRPDSGHPPACSPGWTGSPGDRHRRPVEGDQQGEVSGQGMYRSVRHI